MKTRYALMAASLLLVVSGCKEEEKAEATPAIKPVLAVVANADSGRIASFTGMIEPRLQTSLGFRILGRVVERDADLGAAVRKGEVVARLDPVALQLAVRSAEAGVTIARARFANARASAERIRKLLKRDIASKVQVELAGEAFETAAADLANARARLAKAREQLGHAELTAEFDGVVTSVHTEVGQVVSPGQTVLIVARSDMPEAVVDVPDQLARRFSAGDRFEVSLQVDDTLVAIGLLREVAPQADPATRTRRLRISLGAAAGGFRLGTIVTVTPQARQAAHIELPASGLVESGGKEMVWVIDPASSKVFLHPVKIASRTDSRIEVAEGIVDGAQVVIAGVHSLKPGQLVRISGE